MTYIKTNKQINKQTKQNKTTTAKKKKKKNAWECRPLLSKFPGFILNLRRLVKMTKPLRFENKSLRLKYKCLICIWIIFWAILDLFINPKYLFQNKSFSQTYYFKSEKSFVILTSLLGLKINPGNLESEVVLHQPKMSMFCVLFQIQHLFEKYVHLKANCPRNSKMALKF